MGMYTELIFGASLKANTPKEIIEQLKYMIEGKQDMPNDFSLPPGRFERMLRSSSYYFGVSSAVSKIWKDNISKQYVVSVRCNLKNYNSEIETFISWIKPYIESGSGYKDMYAIVIYEEQEKPTIYYLN